MSPVDTPDVVVLGVGAMGSAAAYHLARRGADVVALDRHNIPNAAGSSHGITRIIRRPQYEDPAYVPLVEDALDRWTALAERQSRPLLHAVGSVDIGPERSGSVYRGSKRACAVHDIEHEDLSAADLNERFPGFDLDKGLAGVYQADGGFLHSRECIVAHVEAAIEAGATIRAREAVEHWEETSGGVRVETDRGSYEANRLVVTAGAWTGDLVPEIDHLLTPERQVLGWFQPANPEQFAPESFPVFVADVEEGHFYGFPTHEIPGVKLGKFNHRRETGHPSELGRPPDSTDESLLRAFAESYLTDAAGPTMRLSTCMFTNTPDEDFIIDTHPETDTVVVGAGFSGHGFKFASAIGAILADLSLDGTTEAPIAPFRLSRFE